MTKEVFAVSTPLLLAPTYNITQILRYQIELKFSKFPDPLPYLPPAGSISKLTGRQIS